MIKLNKFSKYFIIGVFGYYCLTACDDMDATYKKYINGEIVYVNKADSVKVYSGKKRIKLSWRMPVDTKVTKTKVYWNDKADSLEQDIVRTPGLKYVDVMLNNMGESTYLFQIYTYDDKGNSSVQVEASGSSYGDKFSSLCLNRLYQSATFKGPDTAVIVWYPITSNIMLNTQVQYTDRFGSSKKVDITPLTLTTKLLNYQSGNAITYKTLYKPEKSSIDTFYSDINTRNIP